MRTGYIRVNRIFWSALLTLAVMALLMFTISLTTDGIGFTESAFGYGSGYSSGGSGGGTSGGGGGTSSSGDTSSGGDTSSSSDTSSGSNTSNSDEGVEGISRTWVAEVVSEDITGKIDADGVMTQSVTVASSNGNAAVEVPVGTTARDVDGNALTEIIYQEATPAPAPAGRNIMVVADFGPDGATFDPPVTITMTYDPAALAEEVTSEDLVLAHYDTEAGDWVELTDIVVDTVNHTVSGAASHFTQFAVIAEGEVVVESVPTPESTLVLDLAPDASPDGDEFRPLTSKSDEDSGSGISYWLIIVPVIAVLSISLAVYYTFRRRTA